MTRKLIAFLVIGALLGPTLSCVCPVGQPGTTSQASVQIAQPAAGTTLAPGQAVPIVAVASDPAGLTRLEVEVDGAILVTQTSPQPAPNLVASTTWSSDTTGHHVILARAFNAKGQTTQSVPVVVQVQTAAAQGVTPVPTTQPPATQVLPTAPPPPTQPPPPSNHAPIITSFTAEPQTVPAGGSAALAVSAYDPDGDPLSYSWNVEGNRGSITGWASAAYTAPGEPSRSGPVTITAIVSDSKGAVATRSVVVTVVRPAGLYDPGPAFQPSWAGSPVVQDRLGWAIEQQRNLPSAGTDIRAVEQPFERGRMFWYSDVRLIYSLYTDDHRWQVFNDTFSWADPSPTPLPPTGCTAPMQGGFRKVWWNEPNVRARLGCPLQGEQAVNGTIQLFQHGVMIKSGLTGQVFVLFSDNGTWQ